MIRDEQAQAADAARVAALWKQLEIEMTRA
jgi:hypothetical protein